VQFFICAALLFDQTFWFTYSPFYISPFYTFHYSHQYRWSIICNFGLWVKCRHGGQRLVAVFCRRFWNPALGSNCAQCWQQQPSHLIVWRFPYDDTLIHKLSFLCLLDLHPSSIHNRTSYIKNVIFVKSKGICQGVKNAY
jgi:hypothetical protein